MSLNQVKAITIDFTHVLSYPAQGIGSFCTQAIKQAGHRVEPYIIEKQHKEALKTVPRPDPGYVNDASLRETWGYIIEKTCQGHASTALTQTIAEKTYLKLANVQSWRPARHALEFLQFLNVHGYSVHLAANWDTRLRHLVQGLGWSHWFQNIFLSSEIGFEKPSIHFFDTIKDKLELKASQILHIGSHLHQDYQGAKKAGFNAVFLTHNPEMAVTSHTIKHLWQIIPALSKAQGKTGAYLNIHAQNLIANLRDVPESRRYFNRRRYKPINEIVDYVLAKSKWSKKRPEQELLERWQDVIGEAHANRCKPKKILYGRRLVLQVMNPVVRQELLFQQEDIISRIQKVPGCKNINELVLQAG